VQNSDNPFVIPDAFNQEYNALQANLRLLPADQPDAATYQQIQGFKARLDSRKLLVIQAIPDLQTMVTKISADMQTILPNISTPAIPDADPALLGVIPPPPSGDRPAAQKFLATYNALAPQMTFTLNAQNEVANSFLSLPAATQKQAIATITVLYASPRFEVSSGVFFSLLPNSTFSNYTGVAVTGGVPGATYVKIDMTKTVPPLVIPFVGANYRISPEFTWLGGRRGALYATGAIALNPYNTQVEYAGGLSVSWRYLMFGPLFMWATARI
jgi:hypothetical protein